MMSKKDEELANQTLEKSEEGTVIPGATEPAGNLSSEHSMTVDKPRSLARPINTVPVGGFHELPASMLALPYVVIVQNGTNVFLADGKTPAPKGKFYLTDTQEVRDELNFVTLRALVKETMEEDIKTHELKKKTKLQALCGDLENAFDLYILQFPVTSFTNWGRMMSQIMKRKYANSYEIAVNAFIKSATNKSGQQFYVADFRLTDEIADGDLTTLRTKLESYGGALDKRDFSEEDGSVE